MKYSETMRLTRANLSRRRFPAGSSPRSRSGALFPDVKPKFQLKFGRGTTVFTIGSCFARHIEEALETQGVRLPTTDFRAGPSEWAFRTNGLLNEYSPGTIAQRIRYALDGLPFSDETLIGGDDACLDLLLPAGAKPVTRSRAIERRADIGRVYENLRTADIVIITLGLIETWYDNVTGLFLNRMPPHGPGNDARYSFVRLDVDQCFRLLDETLARFGGLGVKIVLTVSPVPLQMTFVDDDAITANEYSKSVLRVCAEMLRQKYEYLDYFPSYEIVRSAGIPGFGADHVHVSAHLVEMVTNAMVDAYAGIPIEAVGHR
jgi:hypothetical protein